MRLSLAAAGTADAAAAIAAYRRRRPSDDLAGRGCRLLLCARDGAELEPAADRLRSTSAEVAIVACDVTREESAAHDRDPLGVREFATHHLPLEDAPRAYEIFRDKAEGCIKVVLQP